MHLLASLKLCLSVCLSAGSVLHLLLQISRVSWSHIEVTVNMTVVIARLLRNRLNRRLFFNPGSLAKHTFCHYLLPWLVLSLALNVTLLCTGEDNGPGTPTGGREAAGIYPGHLLRGPPARLHHFVYNYFYTAWLTGRVIQRTQHVNT